MMTKQFELRLIGAEAPDGQLDAAHLISILSDLQELAVRLGRPVTDSAEVGRPSQLLDQVARLRVGLAPGSTRIQFERCTTDGSLAFDLDHERQVDEAFEKIIEGIASDARDAWVTDPIAETAAHLIASLTNAAPEIEFSVDHAVRKRFKTADVHRETWRRAPREVDEQTVVLVGRLEKVDIGRHDFRIRDDVGNEFTIPKVQDDQSVMHLIGSHVSVAGRPERDTAGRVTTLREAQIEMAADPFAGAGIPAAVELEQLISSVPGPKPGGIVDLSDQEIEAFYTALRG